MNRKVCLMVIVLAVLLVSTFSYGGEKWDEIPSKQLEMRSYGADPDADAYCVFRKLEYFALADGTQHTARLEEYTRLKILTEKGIRYSDIELYNSRNSRIKNVRARVINPDGTVHELKQTPVLTSKYSEFWDTHVMSTSLQGATAGSIVEYKATHFYDDVLVYPEYYLQSRLYIEHSECSFIAGEGFSYVTVDFPGTDNTKIKRREIKNARGRKTVFSAENVLPIESEPYRPSSRILSARVQAMFRYFRTEREKNLEWRRIDDYFSEYLVVNKTKELVLKKIISDITEPESSDEDKARAVYDYVLENYQLLPPSPLKEWEQRLSDVLDDKAGDHRALSLFYYSLLTTADVDCDFALVCSRDHGVVIEDLPSIDIFNYRMIFINIEEKVIRTAIRDRDVPFGFSPWNLTGCKGFIINGRGGEFIDIPFDDYSNNELRHNASLLVSADGVIKVSSVIIFKGQHYLNLHKEIRGHDENGNRNYFSNWLSKRVVGSVIEDVNLIQGKDNITVNMIFSSSEYSRVSGNRIVLNPNLFVRQFNPLRDKVERKYPLWMHYPEKITEYISIKTGKGLKLEKKLEQKMENIGFTAYVSMIDESQGTLYAREYLLGECRLEGDKLKKYSELMSNMEISDSGTLSFLKE